MKKFLAFLCAGLLIFAGCGKNNTEEKKVYQTEEMFTMLEGEYLLYDDARDFKKSKSMNSSMSSLRVMRIEKAEKGIKILVGDGHQGVSLGMAEAVVQNEAGNITFEAAADENNTIKGEFYPDSNTMKCTIKTTYAYGVESIMEYTKFSSQEEIEKHLSGILFADVKGVTEEDGTYYAQINGNKCAVRVFIDTAEATHMGALHVYFPNEKSICSYEYKDGKITLYNYEDAKIAEF